MKTYFKTLAAFAAALAMSPIAHAGFDSGNAGDVYASEFWYSGRDILQRLEIAAKEGHPIYDTTKLREKMEKTRITSADHVFVKGAEVDAKNYYPDQIAIEVNRSRWEPLRRESETFSRLKLAFHEFLWLTGEEDEGFKVSEPILKALNIPNYSANAWLSLPGTAFAVVECAGRTRDGEFVTVIVDTKGAANTPHRAEVRIEKNGNPPFGYRFTGREISQFFESDDEKSNTAIVGLAAYVNKEAPVSIRYSGGNYVDQDLKTVANTGGDPAKGNSMKVWKGSYHASSEMYVMQHPVCSISSRN